MLIMHKHISQQNKCKTKIERERERVKSSTPSKQRVLYPDKRHRCRDKLCKFCICYREMSLQILTCICYISLINSMNFLCIKSSDLLLSLLSIFTIWLYFIVCMCVLLFPAFCECPQPINALQINELYLYLYFSD